MAAAIVSGAAALIRSLNPDLTAPQVVRLLKETARQPGDEGWSPSLGWGITRRRRGGAQGPHDGRHGPSSRVRDLPARVRKRLLSIGFTRRDNGPNGVVHSKISRIDVYMRVDRGPPEADRQRPRRQAPRPITLQSGHRYGFATRAFDGRGQQRGDAQAPGRVDRRRRLARRRLGLALGGRRALAHPRLLARQRQHLRQRQLDPVGHHVDVGHRVVVAEQPEVDPPL
jgi:hypothetical protein